MSKKDKKVNKNISGPEELDKILKRTNPVVWIVLGAHILLLLNFFLWTVLATIEQKVEMTAVVSDRSVAIYSEEESVKSISAGQKVYIEDEAGTVLSVEDDGTILISDMSLKDGAYKCKIVIREIKPVEFLMNK